MIEQEIQGASSSAQVPRSNERVLRLKVHHFRVFYPGFSKEPLNSDCFKECKVSQKKTKTDARDYRQGVSRNLFAYQASSKLLSAATLMD